MKRLLEIVFILLLTSTSFCIISQPAKAQGTVVSILFENGSGEITKTECNNFVVTVYVNHAPQIDF